MLHATPLVTLLFLVTGCAPKTAGDSQPPAADTASGGMDTGGEGAGDTGGDTGSADVWVEVDPAVVGDCGAGGVWLQADDGAAYDLTALFESGGEEPLRLERSGALLLCAGTWTAQIEIAADVAMTGLDGAEQTALRGGGWPAMVSVEGAHRLEITGLTLRDADALFAQDAEIAIQQSVFEENTAEYGGAINARGGRLELTDVVFSRNNSTALAHYTEGIGGALYADGCAITMERVVFEDNAAAYIWSAPSSSNGGALTMRGGSLEAVDSTFTGNSASSYGGTIWASGAQITLRGGLIEGGRAFEGGAMWVDGGEVTLEDATIRDNSGGLFLAESLCAASSTDFIDNGNFDVYVLDIWTAYTWGRDASFICDEEGCQ